jgi:hypothetical protein
VSRSRNVSAGRRVTVAPYPAAAASPAAVGTR